MAQLIPQTRLSEPTVRSVERRRLRRTRRWHRGAPASTGWPGQRATSSTCWTRSANAALAFRSLKDAWADTTTPHDKLMVTVLGGLAEFERELIRARTGEGRKRAQERGVRFGRPRKLTPHQRDEALQRLAAGETMADVAQNLCRRPSDRQPTRSSEPFRARRGRRPAMKP
jgi:Resolvase, N terminal domain